MQIYDLWKETHLDYWTVHCPLIYRKIVEIKYFALQVAILDECQIYLAGGGGGGGKGSGTVSGRRARNLNSRPLGTYEIKMAARTGKRSILTLTQKTIRNYEKPTRLRTNSLEKMEIIPNSIKQAIL